MKYVIDCSKLQINNALTRCQDQLLWTISILSIQRNQMLLIQAKVLLQEAEENLHCNQTVKGSIQDLKLACSH